MDGYLCQRIIIVWKRSIQRKDISIYLPERGSNVGVVGGGVKKVEVLGSSEGHRSFSLNVFVYMCTSMEHWLRLVPLLSLSSGGFQNVCQENFLSL